MEIDTKDRYAGLEELLSSQPVHTFDLEALVDGELTPARKEKVLAAIEIFPDLRQKYEELKSQKAMLCSWWRASSKDS